MFDEFDNIDFYKELYYHELDLKDKISNRINFAFLINTFIIGGLIYVYNKTLSYIHTSFGNILLFLLILLSFIFVVSIILILLSFCGYTYSYLPSAKQIVESDDVFKKYYEDNKEYFIKKNIKKSTVLEYSFKKNISEIYSDSAYINRCQNLKKTRLLRYYSWSIIIIFFLIITSLSLISVQDFSEESKTEVSIGGDSYMAKENEIQAKTEEDCPPEPPKPIRAQLITESFSLKIEKSSSDEKDNSSN